MYRYWPLGRGILTEMGLPLYFAAALLLQGRPLAACRCAGGYDMPNNCLLRAGSPDSAGGGHLAK